MKMKRQRRTSRATMDEIEFTRDFTRLPMADQYLHTTRQLRTSTYTTGQLDFTRLPMADQNFHKKATKYFIRFPMADQYLHIPSQQDN